MQGALRGLRKPVYRPAPGSPSAITAPIPRFFVRNSCTHPTNRSNEGRRSWGTVPGFGGDGGSLIGNGQCTFCPMAGGGSATRGAGSQPPRRAARPVPPDPSAWGALHCLSPAPPGGATGGIAHRLARESQRGISPLSRPRVAARPCYRTYSCCYRTPWSRTSGPSSSRKSCWATSQASLPARRPASNPHQTPIFRRRLYISPRRLPSIHTSSRIGATLGHRPLRRE